MAVIPSIHDWQSSEEPLCYCPPLQSRNIPLYLAQVFSMVLGLDSRQFLNESSLQKTWREGIGWLSKPVVHDTQETGHR